jgi:hypothetical protein
LFKVLRLVWWMCMHPLLWLLTALWFQHSQMKPRFHHLLLVRCDWEIHHIFVVSLQESQSRSHSLRFMRTLEHFRNPSCAKLAIA